MVGRPGDGGKEKQCRRIIFEIQRKRRCRCDRKNDGCRDTLKPPLGVTFGMQDNHPRMQGSKGSMVSRGVVCSDNFTCNLNVCVNWRQKGVKCLGLQLSLSEQRQRAKPVQHVTCNHPKFPTTPHPTWAGVPVKPTPCKPKSKRMAPSKHLPLNEKPIRLPIPFLLAVSIPPATCPHRRPKTWLFYMFVQEAMQ